MTEARRSMWSTFLLSFSIAGIASCGGSGGSSGSSATIDVVGTWQVTHVTCNGSAITSTYIPNSGTLFYTFNGTTLAQAKTSGSCTQTTTMPYSLSGSILTVNAGDSYSITCSPNPCTGTGLVGSGSCGTTATLGSTATSTITTFTGTLMTTRETDAQGSSICTSHGGVIPFTLSMTKQ